MAFILKPNCYSTLASKVETRDGHCQFLVDACINSDLSQKISYRVSQEGSWELSHLKSSSHIINDAPYIFELLYPDKYASSMADWVTEESMTK